MELHPYLNFGGNCKEAFAYYEQHLGGKILMSMTQGDMAEQTKPQAGTEDFVLHARIEIAGQIVMASDVPPPMTWEPMRSAYLTLGVCTIEDAERLHAALADGGKVFMPMGETFYAIRFSMLQDKFGTNWMVIYERPMPQG